MLWRRGHNSPLFCAGSLLSEWLTDWQSCVAPAWWAPVQSFVAASGVAEALLPHEWFVVLEGDPGHGGWPMGLKTSY